MAGYDFKWEEAEQAIENEDETKTHNLLSRAAEKINWLSKKMLAKCTTTSEKPRKLHYMIEAATEYTNAGRGSRDAMKSFYGFYRNLKNQIEYDNKALPDISKFAEKLEAKIKALHKVNTESSNYIIEHIYDAHPMAAQHDFRLNHDSFLRYNCCFYYGKLAKIDDLPVLKRRYKTTNTVVEDESSVTLGPADSETTFNQTVI